MKLFAILSTLVLSFSAWAGGHVYIYDGYSYVSEEKCNEVRAQVVEKIERAGLGQAMILEDYCRSNLVHATFATQLQPDEMEAKIRRTKFEHIPSIDPAEREDYDALHAEIVAKFETSDLLILEVGRRDFGGYYPLEVTLIDALGPRGTPMLYTGTSYPAAECEGVLRNIVTDLSFHFGKAAGKCVRLQRSERAHPVVFYIR